MSVQALSFVLEQSEAQGNARLVLISIANHADSRGENAWPAIATIALESRCADSTVRLAIADLVAMGELEKIPRGGQLGSKFRPTDAYRIARMLPPKVGPSSDESHRRESSELPPKHERATADPSAMNRPRTVQNRPKDTQRAREAEPTTIATTRPDPDGFDEFWKIYPHKVGKGAARKAFAARLKAGTKPADLIAAARVFAEWVVSAATVGELESMRSVPHPSTWLNQERDGDSLTMPGRAPAAASKFERARIEREMRRHGANGRGADRGNGASGVGLGHGAGNLRHLDGGA